MTTKVNFCSNCGNSLGEEARFCPSCGLDVAASGAGVESIAVSRTLEEEIADGLRTNLVGEYDISGLLGRGGMALVYRAHELMLDREVAIKVLPPDMAFGSGMVERFKREAKTSAKLNHPNIIPIYRIGELKGTVYFVMKYVPGKGLDELMAERGRLDVDVVATVLKQVGDALSYAHRSKVIHRDIKPSNIMIDVDGWALVMDFGIAKAGGSSTLTATGAAIGTPHYMSPEQCTGKDVTALSDQYSLAIMAYQMIGGALPFDGETLPEILSQHFFEQPQPLGELAPDCPQTVIEAINRGLSKKPEDRFGTLDAFIKAICSGSSADRDSVRKQLAAMVVESGVRGPEHPPQSPVPLSRDIQPSSDEVIRSAAGAPTTPMPASKASPSAGLSQAPTTPMPAQKEVPLAGFDSGVQTTPMPLNESVAGAATVSVPGRGPAQSATTSANSGKRKKVGLMVTLGIAGVALVGWFIAQGSGTPPTAPVRENASAVGDPPTGVPAGPVDPVAGSPTANDLDAPAGVIDSAASRDETVAVEPPPPVAPANGTLRVIGLPSGARVTVNGSAVTNPGSTQFAPGSYSLVVTAAGYQPLRIAPVVVRDGQTRTIDASGMVRSPQVNEIPVAVDPPVQVADAHPSCVGTPVLPAGSPQELTRIRITDCVVGLTIRVDGRPNENGLFELKPNGRVRIILTADSFATVRIDTTIAPGSLLVVSGALLPRL